MPSSAEGKEIAARLALRLGSGIVTDAVDVQAGEDGLVATQSVFAAAFTTTSRITHGVPVITVKPNSAPVEAAPAAGTVEELAVSFDELATGTKVVSRTRGSPPAVFIAAVCGCGSVQPRGPARPL
ncbi:hypothetical protein SGPA1_22065 [Streptomyces misionensis JCM 4497]